MSGIKQGFWTQAGATILNDSGRHLPSRNEGKFAETEERPPKRMRPKTFIETKSVYKDRMPGAPAKLLLCILFGLRLYRRGYRDSLKAGKGSNPNVGNSHLSIGRSVPHENCEHGNFRPYVLCRFRRGRA